MGTVNKHIIMGGLGEDPRQICPVDDTKVVTILHVGTDLYTASGETKTEWHRVVVFGKDAKSAMMLKKGDGVYIEGRVSQRTWKDRDGTKCSVVETVCEKFLFLPGKRNKQQEE